MNPHEQFKTDCAAEIDRMGKDRAIQSKGLDLLVEACRHRYSYHFTWMGRPIIQFPQDIVAMQELVWSIRPEVIIETGVAHGGSIIYYASLLELIGGEGIVVGVDIDIRTHNRTEIESHPMSHRIKLIQGSSIDSVIISQVAAIAAGKRTLVVLDSNHTHEHVLAELRGYAPLVTPGSYCVVMDTVVEDMPDDFFNDRPWGKGDNPKTAVQAYLAEDHRFSIDATIENKLLLTVAPSGYLRRQS